MAADLRAGADLEPATADPGTATMRATLLRRFDGPAGLRLETWPRPEVAPGEVLLRVRAVCANRMDLDVMHQRGVGRGVQLPHVPGIDPAGDVVAVGEGVQGLRPGQRVVVKPNIACLACRFCRRGQENNCERHQNVGVHRQGGLAEYVSVPARNVFPLPDALSYEEGSAFSHSFPVAWHLLSTMGQIEPDDEVLVVGAAGGLGVATIQLAKHVGARVIAAAGSEDKLALARELGADATLNYATQPAFGAALRELTGGRGPSLVAENSGAPAIWEQLLPALDRAARVVLCGAHAGGTIQVDLGALYRQRVSLLFTAGSTRAEYAYTLDLAGQGVLRPVVHAVHPFEAVQDAYAALLDRANRGKVVVRVAP